MGIAHLTEKGRHPTTLLATRHSALDQMRVALADDGALGTLVQDMEQRSGRALPVPSISWAPSKLTVPVITETP